MRIQPSPYAEPPLPERTPEQFADVAAAVSAMISALQVPVDDHLLDTPTRVASAWFDQLSGYLEDPADHLDKTFASPENAGPVVVAGIRLVSTCAHHLLPFTGWATVAYQPAPGADIVGLSKLARVTTGYARRLQVQERIGAQVADAVMERLDALWACVLITAEHECMTVRGVRDAQARTTTRTIRGAIMSDADVQLVADAHGKGA